jgi:hypothetical protein
MCLAGGSASVCRQLASGVAPRCPHPVGTSAGACRGVDDNQAEHQQPVQRGVPHGGLAVGRGAAHPASKLISVGQRSEDHFRLSQPAQEALRFRKNRAEPIANLSLHGQRLFQPGRARRKFGQLRVRRPSVARRRLQFQRCSELRCGHLGLQSGTATTRFGQQRVRPRQRVQAVQERQVHERRRSAVTLFSVIACSCEMRV